MNLTDLSHSLLLPFGAEGPDFAALAVTEGPDTLAAAGSDAATATATALGEGPDTLAAAASADGAATLARTENPDTLAAAGTSAGAAGGSLALTEGQDTLIAVGTRSADGTLAITDGADGATGGTATGSFIASLTPPQLQSETMTGAAAETVWVRASPRWLRGVPLARRKGPGSNPRSRGYTALVGIPANVLLTDGLVLVAYLTDDASSPLDPGKSVRVGYTLKRLPPDATIDIDMGAAPEQATTITLSTTSGGVAVGSLTIAAVDLPAGLAGGDLALLRVRRIATHAADTCPGRTILYRIDIAGA